MHRSPLGCALVASPFPPCPAGRLLESGRHKCECWPHHLQAVDFRPVTAPSKPQICFDPSWDGVRAQQGSLREASSSARLSTLGLRLTPSLASSSSGELGPDEATLSARPRTCKGSRLWKTCTTPTLCTRAGLQACRTPGILKFPPAPLHPAPLMGSCTSTQVSVPPHIYGHTGHSHTHIHTPIHGTERHMTAGVPLHLLASMHAPTLGVSQPGPALRWPSSQQRNANSWDALPADVRERPGETTRAGSRAGVPG